MNSNNVIFRDAVPAVAGVEVTDYETGPYRYVVRKMMKVGDATRRTVTHYAQRPAALRYARQFLAERAVKAGTAYVPGAGASTMLFKPVGVEVAA